MKLQVFRTHALFIFIILVLSTVIALPYFHKGYFPTHDGEWAVVRLSEMFRELRDFQLPARISGYLNFGYGYPLFNFAYPLPYYLGIPFVLAKVGYVTTIKLLFVVSIFVSGIGMYLASSRMWKSRLAGLVSAVLYLMLPYRMVDLYVRGSLGESLAFAIVPFIIFAVLSLTKKNGWFITSVLALLLAALIINHNIMTVVFGPVIAAVIVTRLIQERALLKYFVVGGLLGLGIASFFWIPAILEKRYILLSTIPIADRNLYFVTLKQLVLPSWGYDVPTGNRGPFTYQLGWPILVAFILAVSVGLKEKKTQLSFIAPLSVFVLYILLLFSPSAPLWRVLPLYKEINYPWTLLAPLGFVMALYAGFLLTKKSVLRYGGIILASIAVVSFLSYARPQEYVDRGEGFYFTNDATTTSSSELMPLWVKKRPEKRPEKKVEILSGTASVENVIHTSTSLSATIHVTSPTTLQVNTIYYPGWQIYLNEKKYSFSYNNPLGVMQLRVSPGDYTLRAHLSDTPLRSTANTMTIISLVGVLGMAGYGVYGYTRNRHKKRA